MTAGRINRFGPPNVAHPEEIEVPKAAPTASIDASDLPSSAYGSGVVGKRGKVKNSIALSARKPAAQRKPGS